MLAAGVDDGARLGVAVPNTERSPCSPHSATPRPQNMANSTGQPAIGPAGAAGNAAGEERRQADEQASLKPPTAAQTSTPSQSALSGRRPAVEPK